MVAADTPCVSQKRTGVVQSGHGGIRGTGARWFCSPYFLLCLACSSRSCALEHVWQKRSHGQGRRRVLHALTRQILQGLSSLPVGAVVWLVSSR